MENKKVILLVVSFIMVISLILNVILIEKCKKLKIESEPSYGHYINIEEKINIKELEEREITLSYFYTGNYDSKTVVERLNYIYDINNIYWESKCKIINIEFEEEIYKLITKEQLKELQEKVKDYQGNYHFEVKEYNQDTGFPDILILTKI